MDKETSPSGATETTGGSQEFKQAEQSAEKAQQEQAPRQNVVSYDEHRRLLSQYKRAQERQRELEARLAEHESKTKQIEEEKLKEAGEWQKLIEMKHAQLAEMQQKLAEKEQRESELKNTLLNAIKVNAVKERLPGQLIRPEYINFVDVDKIAINPETSELDEESIKVVVDEFVRNHSALLKKDTIKLPNGSAQPVTKLSYEEWLKLPLKEKQKRMKDVEGFKPKH
ncbi:MAG: hypothetical protein QW818_02495 [Candidatus Aenigmatarchaeota archaeon]